MNNKIALINQALSAADSSIKLARQLLVDLEGDNARSQRGTNPSSPSVGAPLSGAGESERQGMVGVFDGENMLTKTGEKYPVPANYASKSMLVVGDTLKLSDEGGEKRFKQIEHVKRHRTIGILTKKEGKFRLVTPEGSYKVLPVSVEHFKGEVGDEAVAFLPASNLSVAYAALESVNKKKVPVETTETPSPEPKPQVQGTKEAKPVEPFTQADSQAKETKTEIKTASDAVKTEPKVESNTPKEKKETKSGSGSAKKQDSLRLSPPSEKVVEIKMPELAEDELR